jgi:hypothetical protein
MEVESLLTETSTVPDIATATAIFSIDYCLA